MAGIGSPAISPTGSASQSVTQGTTPWVVDVSKVGGSSITLGQALAAASLPVVLTAAQITTLTPPSSVTVTQATAGNLHATAQIQDGAGTNITSTGGGLDVNVKNSSLAVTEADGANVVLGAKADAKSSATDTTAITMMQVLKQISASVQAPPSQAVTNTGTFAVQATPVTQADTFMLGGVNIKEINAVTPLMGAGNTGTGSLRVTIASDQVSIPVAATLSAETTKVLGVVRTADGSGNLLTSNSTTYTAKFGLDANLLGTLGTAFSTAGKVDVKGADGDVFVRQATAANLNATVVGTGTFAVQATPVTQADTFMLGGVNIKEINAVTPLMGNGNTGTGSLRVTVAADNTAFTVNPASATAPIVSMNSASANSGVNSALAAVFDDVSPTAITENSFGFLRMSTNRNLYGTIRDAGGNERGANVNSSNQLSVSVDNNPVLGVGTNSIGKISDITTSVVPGTAATNLGKAEDAAAVSGDTGVFILATRNDTLAATTNADADYTSPTVGSSGEQVISFAPFTARTSGTGTTTGTSGVSVISAPGASTFLYITDIMIANTGATTSLITFQLDPAGTPTTLGYTIAPAGGGSNIHFNTPLKVTTANKAFGFTAASSSTTIYCTAIGFTAKV